jgi:hypothetical protein
MGVAVGSAWGFRDLWDFLCGIGCEDTVPTGILRFEYGKTRASAGVNTG